MSSELSGKIVSCRLGKADKGVEKDLLSFDETHREGPEASVVKSGMPAPPASGETEDGRVGTARLRCPEINTGNIYQLRYDINAEFGITRDRMGFVLII